MSPDMAWEPPPVPPHGYDWDDISSQLDRRPNQWLRVGDNIQLSVINAIRQGSVRAFRPIHVRGRAGYGYEVRTANNSNGTATLFLRYFDDQAVGS